MGKSKLYIHEEMLDCVVGEKGTPRRVAMEAELQSYLIGEAIKQARKDKKLTQNQLGELMGVQRAQVSRIENGHNLTIGTIVRAFKAMGYTQLLLSEGYLFLFAENISSSPFPTSCISAYRVAGVG